MGGGGGTHIKEKNKGNIPHGEDWGKSHGKAENSNEPPIGGTQAGKERCSVANDLNGLRCLRTAN